VQFLSTGIRFENVDEFRKKLDPSGIYKTYGEFKKRVIQQAEKEINKKTDIIFSFEEIKKDMKVSVLKFCKEIFESEDSDRALINDRITELKSSANEKLLNILKSGSHQKI